MPSLLVANTTVTPDPVRLIVRGGKVGFVTGNMIYYSMTLSRKENKAVVIRASVEALTAVVNPLQDAALATALRLLSAARHEGGTGGVLEDLTDTLVGAGRAFEVLVGADLLTDLFTLNKRVNICSSYNESVRG